MTAGAEPLRVGIIGCGAITETYYLPSFTRVAGCRVTHLVDLDRKRGQALSNRFGIPRFTTAYQDLFDQVDAVVIATPPESHIPITLDCAARRLHVLCEKPLTKSRNEAQQVIAAKPEDVHVAVGMVRRMHPSARLMKQFVSSRIIGNALEFKVEEGSEFKWPLQTPHLFRPNGFGGILMDTGTHIFDLLAWSLDARQIRIHAVRDDNRGGVESNIYIETSMETEAGTVPGTIDLSFTRTLPNRITIIGEQGKIEVPARGGHSIHFYLHKDDSEFTVVQDTPTAPEVPFDPFAAQVEAFASSIFTGRIEYVTVEQAIQTIGAIESCRELRETEVHPWEKSI